MTTPESVEPRYTLLIAVSRLGDLRMREALGGDGATDAPDRAELLELRALSEVVARKAACGRRPTVRAARAAGASWPQIGAAMGTSKQAAWAARTCWIDGRARPTASPAGRGSTRPRRGRSRASRRTADAVGTAPETGARNEPPPGRAERNDLARACKVAALRL
ncbi:hypothetical protein ACIQJT_37115 [Streptomyces sp. NPDC091972]|uniref:hypothetical protein n=1 Tax=Streptomyces sp. NPDC091972 TaxID=3366007 RepID=UPI0037FCC1CB